jgi:flagellar protein FlgJ
VINVADPSLLALEPQSLGSLRRAAKEDPTKSARVVAQQFETLFLDILMKSMRSASQSSGGGLFDSDQTRLYTELMDQQVAQKLASTGKGLGIADMLLAQMKRNTAAAPAVLDGKPVPLHAEPKPIPLQRERAPIPYKRTLPGSDMMPLHGPAGSAAAAPSAKEFVAAVWEHAAKTGQELGVAPHALVAQAALETGWGRHEIKLPDGSSSHNVFGIKAGADWQGKVAETATTEYVNGVAQTRTARFRAYDSYAEAFQDYANLLRNSPRYASALQATEPAQFAAALQQAGYATDPAYAAKLSRVMASASLRQALLA